MSAGEAAASLQFFLSIVEQAFGKRPVIYTYPSFWRDRMGDTSEFAEHHHLWIANYGQARADGGFDGRQRSPVVPGTWPTFSIWQNAVQPGVAGIRTLVDRNVAAVPNGMDLPSFLARIP